jgi:hypothetical protein
MTFISDSHAPNLHALPTVHQSAKDLLERALEAGFSTVIVLGFKDGEVSIDASDSIDFLKVLGAVEYAKQILIDNWKEQ